MLAVILICKVFFRRIRNKIHRDVFHRPVFQQWMTHGEIVILEDVLHSLKPKRCLEWGAGYSTLLFPGIAPKDTTWIAVEHVKDWAEKIKEMNKNPRTTIAYVAPNNPLPWSAQNGDGSMADLKDYIEFPNQFKPFDFILIDGRARAACLIKAVGLCEKDGIVILHDAERENYHQSFGSYKHSFSISDHTQGIIKLWIGSNDVNISRRFNTDAYIKLATYLKLLDNIRRKLPL